MAAVPAQAHNWVPNDGSAGYTSHKGCDGPTLDQKWPFNDGNVCYKHWYYDHGDHLHFDHTVSWFTKNQTGQSDSVSSITNQTVDIYWGNCDLDGDRARRTFPLCYYDGFVHGPVCSYTIPDM
jgi:hypothetical protein